MITSYAFTTAKMDFLVSFYEFIINAKNIYLLCILVAYGFECP